LSSKDNIKTPKKSEKRVSSKPKIDEILKNAYISEVGGS
jgi:hypothetical protein